MGSVDAVRPTGASMTPVRAGDGSPAPPHGEGAPDAAQALTATTSAQLALELKPPLKYQPPEAAVTA